MYKHGAQPVPEEDKKLSLKKSVAKESLEQKTVSSLKTVDDFSDMHELLEKNLKWSQIIYEQNRKINNKLLWSAIANWARLAVLVVPIIFALLYLPPILSSFEERYVQFFSTGITSGKSQSIKDLLNLLPLSNSQRDQVKAMMK